MDHGPYVFISFEFNDFFRLSIGHSYWLIGLDGSSIATSMTVATLVEAHGFTHIVQSVVTKLKISKRKSVKF